MKNKTFHRTDEFRQLKTKFFLSAMGMAAFAAGCIFLLYALILRGRFADWIVALNQKAFRLDYTAARTLYQWTLRNQIGLVFTVGVVFAFFITFRIYLNWFTKYFKEINRGIEEIGNENGGEVSLPPELSAAEKKINELKHNLEKQKLDMKLAEQQKNDMVMYLAHDLKTPLASVIGYLNLLHDEEQISEELRQKYLSVTLDKAERLDDLLNEFFDIAKFNLSDITLQYTRVSLTRLLEMLLYEFQPMLREKNLDCKLMVPEDIMLRCDANKMERVFDNILKNAILYSFEGTAIDVAAARQGENIVITFTNRGDTIPEEKLEQIFEQFYRLDSSRSTGSGGAGLGLAIAKQIIERHNGSIMARSENETVEFKVTLPIS